MHDEKTISVAIGPPVPLPAESQSPAVRRARRQTYRIRGAMLILPSTTILGIGCWLRPLPSGEGTHQELGLPACSFLMRTGLPCPSCGLTTSVSAMCHGEVLAAFHAQPSGVLLFLALVAAVGIGTVELFTGHDVLGRLHPGLWWVAVGLVAMLAGWLWKLTTGLANGTYPLK